MSLVVTLLLFFWMMSKLMSEKVKSDNFDYDYETKREDFEKFSEEYSSDITWEKFREKYLYTEEIEGLKEYLKEIIGVTPADQMLYHACLAFDGKVPSRTDLNYSWVRWNVFTRASFIQLGCKKSNPWISDLEYNGETTDIKELEEARKKFLLWYDKTLSEHGMPYPLMTCYLTPEEVKDTHRSKKLRTQIDYSRREIISEKTCMDVAGFFWEPTRKDIEVDYFTTVVNVTNDYDRRFDRRWVDLEKFCEEYSSNISWYRFTKQLLDTEKVNKLKDELKEIIGVTPSNQMLFHAYLALDGKVPPRDDFAFPHIYEEMEIFDAQHDKAWKSRLDRLSKRKKEIPPSMEEVREARKKFLLWYDKTLFKNGMPYPLMTCYLAPDKPREKNRKHRIELDYRDREQISEKTSMDVAVFFWEPTRYVINDIEERTTDVKNIRYGVIYMSKWENELDNYIEEEMNDAADEALDELVEEIADEIVEKLSSEIDKADENEEMSLIDIFGSEELVEQFRKTCLENKNGTCIIDPEKLKEVKKLKEALREIFGNEAKITVGMLDVGSRSWSVKVEGKSLTVNSPVLLKKAFLELSDGGEIATNLNNEVRITFTVKDITLKMEEE